MRYLFEKMLRGSELETFTLSDNKCVLTRKTSFPPNYNLSQQTFIVKIPFKGYTKAYDLVYNWFDILVSANHAITGYVIMPNHLHMLLYFAGAIQSLNIIVGNGKWFIAYHIVKGWSGKMKAPARQTAKSRAG